MVLRVIVILWRRLDGSLTGRDGVLQAVLFYVARAEVVGARPVGLGNSEVFLLQYDLLDFKNQSRIYNTRINHGIYVFLDYATKLYFEQT